MSAADPVPPIAAGVGADLRAAREAAGWTLPQLAAHLRIRLPYLEALEEGRIGLLPANAYAVAFMRSYASALGLDPEEIVRRFRREAAEVNARTELEFPAPLPERGIPAGAIAVVGLVIAIGGYAVWWHGGGAPAPAPRVADVPSHIAALAVPVTPTQAIPPAIAPAGTAPAVPATPSLPASGDATPAANQAAPAAAAATGAQPTTGTTRVATTQGPASAAAVAPIPPAFAPRIPDVSPASAAAATAPTPPIVTPAQGTQVADANTIVLGATADAWLEVRNQAGQVLLNKVLHKGDTWPVPDQQGLVLTTGNAGGTTITVGSTTISSLGGDGVVRHNLPLDPTVIRAGGLAASAAPPKQVTPKTN